MENKMDVLSHNTIPLPINTSAIMIFVHAKEGLCITVYSDNHTAITEARRAQENPQIESVQLNFKGGVNDVRRSED